MKRIIDGKRYNTETATEITSREHGYYNDFHHYSETLYRTRKGAFFLHGEGGPLSKYGCSLSGSMRGSGSDLIVLTEHEARDWLEQHGCTHALETLYGDSIEDA